MLRFRLIMFTVIAPIALSACHGKTEDAAKGAQATTAPAAANKPAKKDGGLFGLFGGNAATDEPAQAPELGEFKIATVTLGSSVDNENNVVAGKTVFTPREPIYAAVLSTGTHQGLKISAKWTTADGQLIADTEQTLVPASATITTFSVRNPGGWPAGKYQVAISIDRHPMETRSFEVR
ncbi:MAG TPA: hypothetical protein VKM35_04615 [Arenimonas sp.]|uniref:hypothetical protein n=1 Tax=Arenimonas sp. TaxID=1872635 RepID=UPI002B602D83|nr:hypothetical protein [Arenimonas sp.]HMB56471.1 hypothetical protein [Arenimonas sp.]